MKEDIAMPFATQNISKLPGLLEPVFTRATTEGSDNGGQFPLKSSWGAPNEGLQRRPGTCSRQRLGRLPLGLYSKLLTHIVLWALVFSYIASRSYFPRLHVGPPNHLPRCCRKHVLPVPRVGNKACFSGTTLQAFRWWIVVAAVEILRQKLCFVSCEADV